MCGFIEENSKTFQVDTQSIKMNYFFQENCHYPYLGDAFWKIIHERKDVFKTWKFCYFKCGLLNPSLIFYCIWNSQLSLRFFCIFVLANRQNVKILAGNLILCNKRISKPLLLLCKNPLQHFCNVLCSLSVHRKSIHCNRIELPQLQIFSFKNIFLNLFPKL